MATGQIIKNSSLPQSLWRAEGIYDAEKKLAATFGVPLYELMERAGKAAFDCIERNWPLARNLLVCCGKGNNGGDGYVVARLAKQQGLTVQLLQLGDPSDLEGDAATARDLWLRDSGIILSENEIDWQVELVVDALLGTGLKGTVRADYTMLIDRLNALSVPRFSLDLPSGLDADRGVVLGAAVRADRTLSFVGLKQGLCTSHAQDQIGVLEYADLGIGDLLEQQFIASAWRDDYPSLSHWLKPRFRTAHKGHFGYLLVVGGGEGMPGALRLSTMAALRSGAGLVRGCTLKENIFALAQGQPEVMLSAEDPSPYLEQCDALVIGPGLGQDDWAMQCMLQALDFTGPMVVDADGLNLLAKLQPKAHGNWLLTPHPGEAACLLDCTVAQIEMDRFAAVLALQQLWGGVVLLKGAGTLICDGQTTFVCSEGNPGMASGGMGDLLSGIIGALLAQGWSLTQAARLGAVVHGEAGDCAAREGERGMLASDLLPWIRQLFNPEIALLNERVIDTSKR